MNPKAIQLRTVLRSRDDLQKLRIQMGNRIVAAYKNKLGIQPSEAEDSEDNKEAEKILDTLRAEYKRITDGVKKITRATNLDSELLTDYTEVKLIEAYESALHAEELHEVMIESELEDHPVYTEYLTNIRGCGRMMSAYIICEIDINIAENVSKLWKYCGLDVLIMEDGTGEGRCRKPHHLVPKTYEDKLGNVTHTKGISFHPMLKTKLVGVLGGCLMKAGGKYKTVYDGYKHRLNCSPRHADKTLLHKHRMALRYMMKIFLQDLYVAWRTLEGLPVRKPYAEEKLGLKHSTQEFDLAA